VSLPGTVIFRIVRTPISETEGVTDCCCGLCGSPGDNIRLPIPINSLLDNTALDQPMRRDTAQLWRRRTRGCEDRRELERLQPLACVCSELLHSLLLNDL
jgi:hypothetical protein